MHVLLMSVANLRTSPVKNKQQSLTDTRQLDTRTLSPRSTLCSPVIMLAQGRPGRSARSRVISKDAFACQPLAVPEQPMAADAQIDPMQAAGAKSKRGRSRSAAPQGSPEDSGDAAHATAALVMANDGKDAQVGSTATGKVRRGRIPKHDEAEDAAGDAPAPKQARKGAAGVARAAATRVRAMCRSTEDQEGEGEEGPAGTQTKEEGCPSNDGGASKKSKAATKPAPTAKPTVIAVPSGGLKGGASQAMERALQAEGYAAVGGLDEAGRGPLAGPVVAAVCVLPEDFDTSGIEDSKAVVESDREALFERLTTTAGVLWAAHVVDHTTIDRINILQAAMTAMREASNKLPPGSLDFLLVDGNRIPTNLPAPAQAVIKGDARVTCIAAASIIAKVTRDRIMMEYDQEYPQYNFGQHKGYAVPAHYAAIEAHGPCAIHRRSFQPIRGMTGWTREAQLAQEAAQSAGDATEECAPQPVATEEPVAGTDAGGKKSKRGRPRKSVP